MQKCNDNDLLRNSPKYYKYACKITFKKSDDECDIYIDEIIDYKPKPAKCEFIDDPELTLTEPNNNITINETKPIKSEHQKTPL